MAYECLVSSEVAGDGINTAYVSGPFNSRQKLLMRKSLTAAMLILVV